MWKISNENDIFKKRKPLPPKKSEESQPELTPWQKQNQEYLKKQAEEAASKGENEQAEVTITLQEQSQEEPQQHLHKKQWKKRSILQIVYRTLRKHGTSAYIGV